MGSRMRPSAPQRGEQPQVCASHWAEEVYYLKVVMVQHAGHGGGNSRVPLPVAWHFSARCLFSSMFSLSASDRDSLEESPLLRSAEHRRGLAAPGFLGVKLSNYKLLVSFFGNFMPKFCFSSKLKVND